LSEDIRPLLQGKFPELKKLKLKELREEVQMWRNLWGWIPSAVKYYVSRTGSTIGVTIRNYRRFIGPLLETEWDLKGIEVGVYDKVYDQSEGKYFWERKIIKVPIGAIVQFDWIAERVAEEKLAEAIQQAEEQPTRLSVIGEEKDEDQEEEDKPPRV
jgi:hypothetical protein